MKRIPVKWIRDRAKSAYEKDSSCYICGSTSDLELHHTHSVTALFERWLRETGYTVSSDEEILAIRDEFISAHHDEIYVHVFTLCSTHHKKLHSIYGAKPGLATAMKQVTWVERQRENGGSRIPSSSYGSFFSEFT